MLRPKLSVIVAAHLGAVLAPATTLSAQTTEVLPQPDAATASIVPVALTDPTSDGLSGDAASDAHEANEDRDTTAGFRPNPFPLEVHVYANGLARHEDKRVDENGLDVTDFSRIRAIDLDMRAPISDDMDLVLIPRIATDRANTDYELDVQSAYVSYDLSDVLGTDPWRLEFRAGEMRTAFGWLNSQRLFDLPQVDRPRALSQFFGDDGYVQTSYQVDLGVPVSEQQSVTLTGEIVDSGDPPLTDPVGGNVGAVSGRLEWAGQQPSWGWTLGASGMRAQQQDKSKLGTQLFGADFLLELPGPGRKSWLGGEWIGAEIDREAAPVDEPDGYYLWAQSQVAEDWYMGARFDSSSELDSPNTTTDTLALYLTWAQTSDLRYSLMVQESRSDLVLLDEATRVFVEINFALGANPLRPFWR